VLDAFNEATGNPLIDQDSMFVRYEVRTNQSEYTYFLNNTYYNADSQIVAVSQNRFVGFPNGLDPLAKSMPPWAQYGATEVKASWRIFPKNTPASIKNRYFHRSAILVDQNGNLSLPVTVGLIGFHILRLTPSTGTTWYWASFEQVDNLKLQPQYGGSVPGHPTFNTNPAVTYGDSGYSYIPAAVAYKQPLPPAIPVGVSAPPFLQSNNQLDSINKAYNKAVTGTPLQYYQLVGTVNPPTLNNYSQDSQSGYPSVNLNTVWMANSTLETYVGSFATNTNCVTCHISGYPQMPDSIAKTSALQVFTFLPSQAQTSNTSKTKLSPIKFTKLKRGMKRLGE
jgi:hypothetical protein